MRIKAAMAGVLTRLRERGPIAVGDLDEAAEMLCGMMAMEPQRAAMLDTRVVPSDAEIRARDAAAGCSSTDAPRATRPN